MINLPNPADLLWWQIKHYTQRLSEAKTTKEKAFLRGQLYNLKKKRDAND